MLTFAARRVVIALAVAATVSVVSFLLLHLSGDLAQAMAGPEATPAQVAAVRTQYGLDRPLVTQYGEWLWHALHLDFGRSFYFREDVSKLIAERFPVTIMLGALALSLALLVAVPLGALSALRRDTWVDRGTMALCVVSQAMPSFWFSLMLVSVFSITFRWLPVSGNTTWQHYVLPAAALGFYAMPAVLRLTRAGMLDVLSADYIRTARAKGLPRHKIIVRHALRNAIVPVVALAAVQFGFLLGGSIVIEAVFSLQGLGQLAWDSISRNDFPVVQSIVLVLATIYVVLNMLADILNGLLDPRLRP